MKLILLSKCIINLEHVAIVHYPDAREVIVRFTSGQSQTFRDRDAAAIWDACSSMTIAPFAAHRQPPQNNAEREMRNAESQEGQT